MKMAATMHDLRLSLRDKMKTISELESKINELKAELFRKDSQICEYEIELKKKDEIIILKDSVIKEKDLTISNLENSLKKATIIDNHVQNSKNNSTTAVVSAVLATSKAPNEIVTLSNNEQTVTLALPNKKQAQLVNQLMPANNLSKTKRMAISAEPAQLNKKSKDFKTYLKEYEKSEEYALFRFI